ncbi:MAG: hypothetical protein Q9190_005217 [Brigantiaea leucoxantha]
MDYAAYYNPPVQQNYYYGIQTRPDHPYTPQDDTPNDPMESYRDPNSFIPFDQFNIHAQPIITQPQSPPHSIHRASVSQPIPRENSNDTSGDMEIYEQGQGRSSDDEKDNLTPAQTRRKAQNRAAQRAFRERKERHVKDLEGKLNSVNAHNSNLVAELAKLRREYEKVTTQNEMLRATSAPNHLAHQNPSNQAARPQSPLPGPLHYSPGSFHAALSMDHTEGSSDQRVIPPISHRIDVSPATGERMYATGATWDFIQSHELFRKGMVDVSEVSQRLQGQAMCDGSGPAFPESAIIRAIEDSSGGAGDVLI